MQRKQQHLQLHAPPLPATASEARSPRSSPLGAWLHCELSLGVTGSYTAFSRRHPSLAIHSSLPTTSQLQTAARSPRHRQSVAFQPSLAPERVPPRESAAMLAALPAAVEWPNLKALCVRRRRVGPRARQQLEQESARRRPL